MFQSFQIAWSSFLTIPLLGAAPNVQELPGNQLKTISAQSPANRQKEDRRQARALYGAALLNARNKRLLEAVCQLEQARKLDPTAAPVARALIPLYLSLGRTEDALSYCRRTLDLDPDDFETWYSYARQLKDLAKTKEATEAMARAVSCPSLKDRPHELAQITFDLGVLCEESSNLPKALAAFRRAETSLLEHRQTLIDSGQVTDKQLHAELARTLERKAHVCAKLKKFNQAARAYEEARTIFRDDLNDLFHSARLNLELAKAYRSAGRQEKSLAVLDEYLRTQPPEAEPYRLRIAILIDLGREGEIIPSLKTYADQDNRNVALHLLLAELYSQKSTDWNKAQEEYNALLRENPNAEAYHGLFEILSKKGRVEEVLSTLDQAVAGANPTDKSHANPSEAAKARTIMMVIGQDPELIGRLIPLGVARTRGSHGLDLVTRQFLALLAARTKQLPAAESLYRSCLEEPRDLPSFLPQEQEIYSGLLRVLRLQGKHQEVIETCKRGLTKIQAANRLLLYGYLAETYSFLGQEEEALNEADQALQLADEKSRLDCQIRRARILAEANQRTNAIHECQPLLKDDAKPEDVHAIRLTLYGIYSTAHQNDKAEEQLRRILQDLPDDAGAHNDLGYLMADQGKNLPEAEELIRRAIELDRQQKHQDANAGSDDDQDNAAFVDSLGWVLFRRGRVQEALHELLRATTLPEGDDPVIWDHLGDVYLLQGESAKARDSWSKAISLYEKERRRKLDDQYKELKHKLKQLENP